MDLPDVNLWRSAEHALDYLARADTIPHRAEGEGVLLECLLFTADASVEIIVHDLARKLPASLGMFDAVVSSFAIHHLRHERKRSLYEEACDLLEPGGVFCNLEHVASPTETLHHQFLASLSMLPEEEDPSNKLLDVETQLGWLRAIGFVDVDCHWKWRELALLTGAKPE